MIYFGLLFLSLIAFFIELAPALRNGSGGGLGIALLIFLAVVGVYYFLTSRIKIRKTRLLARYIPVAIISVFTISPWLYKIHLRNNHKATLGEYLGKMQTTYKSSSLATNESGKPFGVVVRFLFSAPRKPALKDVDSNHLMVFGMSALRLKSGKDLPFKLQSLDPETKRLEKFTHCENQLFIEAAGNAPTEYCQLFPFDGERPVLDPNAELEFVLRAHASAGSVSTGGVSVDALVGAFTFVLPPEPPGK